MITISDEMMRERLAGTRSYTFVLLKSGPKRGGPDDQKIIWEHGRRNFQLRAERKLAVVCPMTDGGAVAGIGIFDTDVEEARRIMDGDPAVKAGILVYELHACKGFRGDALP